jgi:hypothetical protein
MVITSTMATWPHSIAISPSQTSPLASIARTDAGDAGTPVDTGIAWLATIGMAHVTAAEHSIMTAAAMYGPIKPSRPARMAPRLASSSSEGPTTAPMVAAQTIQPITVPRRAAG